MGKANFSKVVAGVMKWGQWGAKLDTAAMAKLIRECVDIGVTTFDHADIYGDHTTETDWGLAYQTSGVSRSDIEIISKCGIMMPSPQRPKIKHKHYDTSVGHIIKSVETSLTNLKTDHLDLLLIHRPSPLMRAHDIASAFERLRASGKVLRFGVSNFTTSQMQLVDKTTDIRYNQMEISTFALDPFVDGTLDYCMTHGIRPMAWSPLGGGRLFSALSRPDEINRRSRLSAVAHRYGWSLDEMAYLFILHHPADIQIVTGSSKIERIQTACDAVHTIISDAQWYEIWTAATGVDVP